jgi:hypothetical protein
MALSPLLALGFRTAHESMARILRENGTEPDYSIESLGGLERFLARHSSPTDAPPALSEAELRGLLFRAAAYAAEALLRAIPAAEVSVKDHELVLTVPCAILPGLTLDVFPRLRVAKVLYGEEALLDWVVFLLATAVLPSAGPES